MGIIAKIASGDNHPDNIFARTREAIVLNDLPPSSRTNDLIKSLTTRTIYVDKSNYLSLSPTCACGYLTDALSVGNVDKTCPICKTSLREPMSSPIEPICFFRTPPGIHSLLQPIFVMQFMAAFNFRSNQGNQSFDTFLYLATTTYKGEHPGIEALNLPRGYNNFVTNLESIMEQLIASGLYKTKTTPGEVLELYRKEKQNIHCNYLYLINNLLNVAEVNSLSTYVNKGLLPILAIGKDMSIGPRANQVAKILHHLAEFYIEYTRTILGGKHGGIRTSIFSVRGNVSMRTVLTSITTDLVVPDEVHLPYAPTIQMLTPQIMGKLFKQGYSHKRANDRITRAKRIYDHEIWQIMNEICGFTEVRSKDRVLRVITQRFPSLNQGNFPVTSATCIKQDHTDMTMALSILSVRAMNADYDGDCLVLTIVPPYKSFNRLEYHNNLLSLSKARQLNDYFILTDPVVSNIDNWFKHNRSNEEDISKTEKLKQYDLFCD